MPSSARNDVHPVKRSFAIRYPCANSLDCASCCHSPLYRLKEDQPVERVPFDLLLVLNADVVSDAGMAEVEGFSFSVPNDLPLYFWPARLYFRKEQGRI